MEGTWEFAPLAGSDEAASVAAASGRTYPYRLAVPGCWEMHPDLQTYRGKGVYRKTVDVSRQGSSLQFEFKGVSHTADVFFDGVRIASHYNAYTAFKGKVRNVSAGAHELLVVVDNSFGEASSLHVPNDYYTYGGIIRPVAMEEIGDLTIVNVAFTPSLADGEWKAEVSAACWRAAVRSERKKRRAPRSRCSGWEVRKGHPSAK